MEYKNVTQTDREQAKRIVYSVIYGVGKERLSECLGTTPTAAIKFIEQFMQKYRVCDFTQTVVHECRSRVIRPLRQNMRLSRCCWLLQ
uniref:DNA-directed DNA polymerase family A palm domain-containing protein n=1 Tax=Pyxicephalus adspersus TaxID=30357 RepID=A0AAV3ANI4_PYXAD|nr:TPA: hypothetical protein GDO54_009609 [Pyxicephalus adspersus]